jgi:hypothetical protein
VDGGEDAATVCNQGKMPSKWVSDILTPFSEPDFWTYFFFRQHRYASLQYERVEETVVFRRLDLRPHRHGPQITIPRANESFPAIVVIRPPHLYFLHYLYIPLFDPSTQILGTRLLDFLFISSTSAFLEPVVFHLYMQRPHRKTNFFRQGL